MLKSKNILHFPDKPNEISFEMLHEINEREPGKYIATWKYDGYRGMPIFGPEIGCWSRRAKNAGGPSKHPSSPELLEELEAFKINNKIPENSSLDGEWMARRATAKKPDYIVIFGVFYWGDKYLGKKPEEERWKLVSNLKYSDRIILANSANKDYVKFYEESKKHHFLEGIVLKHKRSMLVGNIGASKNNPLWMKCRWRKGDDGLTIVE